MPLGTLSCDDKRTILDALEGPYNDDSYALYWESILSIRRLLFTVTVFIDNRIIKFVIIETLCIVSLLHHSFIKPFKHPASNQVEMLSLIFLSLLDMISGLKLGYINVGVQAGPVSGTFQVLNFVEGLFPFVILLFIIIQEIKIKAMLNLKNFS